MDQIDYTTERKRERETALRWASSESEEGAREKRTRRTAAIYTSKVAIHADGT
jgi:hypothetical protein